MRTKSLLFCLGAIFTVSVFAVRGAETEKHNLPKDINKLPPAADRKDVTYASDIKSIFDQYCVKCHGPEKPKKRLRLDNLEGALKGGKSGKAIEPGNSAESSLVHKVGRLGDPEDFMPPPNNKAKIPQLTRDQVALLRAWIDQGAK